MIVCWAKSLETMTAFNFGKALVTTTAWRRMLIYPQSLCPRCTPRRTLHAMYRSSQTRAYLVPRTKRTCLIGSFDEQYQPTFLQQRLISTSGNEENDQDHSDKEMEEMEKWLKDLEYEEAFQELYLLPSSGHRVLIVQPDFKTGEKRFSTTTTSAQMQLMESVALVQSLPRWSVVKTATFSVKNQNKARVWGKGTFEEISKLVSGTPGLTAVVVNLNMLSGLQLTEFQNEWRVPVYDRYTLVLQIFQARARTKLAKLQVALAEIPYLRSRLRGTHAGDSSPQYAGFKIRGGQSFDDRKELLQNREHTLKKAIAKIADQRQVLKRERKRREIPTVAVVGYTNAGKTSLIKALTEDNTMQPRNQLFATLDVTVHGGKLLHTMPVLYIDTVGFISNIPTQLIASFSATLNDMLDADAILVVNDVSQSDYEWQRETVLSTLHSLNLPDRLASCIIEVDNKVDLVKSAQLAEKDDVFYVSATQGIGLELLEKRIKTQIIQNTDRLQKRLRIPLNGRHLSWLYKEANVERTHTLKDDHESILVDVIITKSGFSRFKNEFGKSNNNR